MGVPQYTTPTFELTFGENVDLTYATTVYVTFSSGSATRTKTGDDLTVEAHSIRVWLSQEDTKTLGVGPVRIQANWMDEDGNRVASDIAKTAITEQLLKQVIS